MTNNKEIQTILDVPITEHWQLIQFEQKSIDDGYGGNSYISIPKIFIFTSTEELEREVLRIQSDNIIIRHFLFKKFPGALKSLLL